MMTRQLPLILGLLVASVLAGQACAQEPFPEELTHFEPIAANPVFTAGGEGKWDVKIRERGWILRDGDNWRMWYTGYDGTRAGIRLLGYATSKDGLTWNRFPDNPIHEGHWVEDVCVIPHQGTLYMFAEGEQDRRRSAFDFGRRRCLDPRRSTGCATEKRRTDSRWPVRNAHSMVRKWDLEPVL